VFCYCYCYFALIIILFVEYTFKRNKKLIIPIFISLLGYFILPYLLDLLQLTSENVVRFTEVLNYILHGFQFYYFPPNLVSRLNDIEYIWSNFSSSHFLFTGINHAYYLAKFANSALSYNNQYFAWIVNFGLLGVLMSIWSIFFPIFLYKHSKIAIDRNAKILLKTLAYIFIAEIIMAITQENIFARRWREFIFVFMALTWVYYKKSQEIYTIPLKFN